MKLGILGSVLMAALMVASCGSSEKRQEHNERFSFEGTLPAKVTQKPKINVKVASFRFSSDAGGERLCLPLMGCTITQRNTLRGQIEIQNGGPVPVTVERVTVMKKGRLLAHIEVRGDIAQGEAEVFDLTSEEPYESGPYSLRVVAKASSDASDARVAKALQGVLKKGATKRLVSIDCEDATVGDAKPGEQIVCSGSDPTVKSSWDAMRTITVSFGRDGKFNAVVAPR